MKKIIVFYTHTTLGRNHADMCLHHLGRSSPQRRFDKLYIYNSHADELPNADILDICCHRRVPDVVEDVEIIPYDPDTKKTLGSDFLAIQAFLTARYAPTDAVLLLKSDIMMSRRLLAELFDVVKPSFFVTPPFILSKARVTDEQIIAYTARPAYVLSDDVTFFNEDSTGSANTDHATTRSMYDHSVQFISSTIRRDFSCHYFTLDMFANVCVGIQEWGGVNFRNMSSLWDGTERGFTVHKYHEVVSANNTSDRYGMDYIYS